MPDANINLILRALDQGASQTVKRLTGNVADLGKGASGLKGTVLTGVGIGAGVLGFNALSNVLGGVVGALGDAFRGAVEEEKGIARLTSALRANVAGWNGNTDAIEAAAKANMRLGFADDETRDSITRLVVATKNEAEALKLQHTAMDLARLKSVDLGTASTALAKAWGGSTRELKALGIVIEDASDKTAVLAAVQKAAEGQALAWSKTTEGKLETTQVQLNEALEKLGEKAIPVAVQGADILTSTLEGVDKITTQWESDMRSLGDFLFGTAARDTEAFKQAAWDAQAAIYANQRTAAEAAAASRMNAILWEKSLRSEDASIFTHNRALQSFKTKVHSVLAAVRVDAPELASAIGQAFEDAQSTTSSAINEAVKLLKGVPDALDPVKRQVYLKAFLAGKEYAKGIVDTNPYIKAKFRKAGEDAIAELNELKRLFYYAGGNAGKSYSAGFSRAVSPFLQKLPGLEQGDTGGSRRAGGGPVSQGQPYLVGERGPELMVPSQSGTIVPNSALGGRQVIENHIYLDSRHIDTQLYYAQARAPRTSAAR